MDTSFKEPVYIIIPVHNRKSITLKCLENLNQQGSLHRYHVVIVDDGSIDGTAEAIQSLYSDIIIIAGDGNLWWTGAIKKGMEYAYKKGAEYFIWLNDDCYPQEGAIENLLNKCINNSMIIAGAKCLDPDNYQISYSGIIGESNKIVTVNTLSDIDLECDGLNGNLVCIPKGVVQTVGYPNTKLFPQYHGDTTYTHLAKKKGYKLLLSSESLAFCKNNHPYISWVIPDISLLEYWKNYFNIKSPYYWKAELFYYIEILGLSGICLYLKQNIQLNIKFWLIFLFIYPLPLKWRIFIKKTYRNLFNSST